MRKRPRLARWVRWIGLAAVVGAFLGVVSGGVVYAKYDGRAAEFDLSLLNRDEMKVAVKDRRGRPMGYVAVGNRLPVALSDVPEHLIKGLVATEDRRFFRHSGTDTLGILRAAVENLKAGRIVQGGSTLTQQLARQTFSLTGKSFDRKLTEACLARRIEREFDKERILEAYLNRIYLGHGYTGVGAAAQGYFGKDISELDVAESALLVGIIKSPNRYSPWINEEFAEDVRDQTIRRMVSAGHLSRAGGESLLAKDLGVLDPDDVAPRPHYVLEAVQRELEEIVPKSRWGEALEVETSYDSELQSRVLRLAGVHVEAVEKRLQAEAEEPLQVAVVVLENATGNVVASVGGRDFRTSPFDRAFLGRRPAGTVFAPVVYTAAFHHGAMAPFDRVMDVPMNNRKVMVGGVEGTLGEWGTENESNVYEGEITAAYALLRGKNAATVEVGSKVGLEGVMQVAERMGIESELRNYPSTFLGASEVGMLEIAMAYSSIANLGERATRTRLVKTVRDEAGGEVVDVSGWRSSFRAVSEEAAGAVSEILSGAMKSSWSKEELARLGIDAGALAGHGGASYEFNDSWFAGYSRDLTCVVWMGYDTPRPMGAQGFGRRAAFPLWAAVMAAAGSGTAPVRMVDSGAGKRMNVCVLTGLKEGERCAEHGGAECVAGGGVLGGGLTRPGGTCEHPARAGLLAAEPKVPRATVVGARQVVAKQKTVIGYDPYLAN